MREKILVAKDTILGNLNDYIKFISTLIEEFNLNAAEISEIHSDSRDMLVKFSSEFGIIELEFSYDLNELYLNVACNDKNKNEIAEFILRTRELVADNVEVTEKQKEAIDKILDKLK